jgi:hypothetical protein
MASLRARLVALTCTVVVVGGGGAALAGDHPQRNPPDAAARSRVFPARSSLWLVATAEGEVRRSSGLVGLTRLGAGRYEARFAQDVHDCGYTATVGDPVNGLVYSPGLAFTAGGHLSPQGVYVETKNLGGGLSDFPFHLTVSCGGTEYAVVDPAAARHALMRGSARSVTRLGTGRFAVYFGRDLGGCAYTATVADSANRPVYNPGLAFTTGDFDSGFRAVSVETKDLAGQAADRPFHLGVHCADGGEAERLSAVAGADGSLARGNRAVSAQRLGTGRYDVRFDRDVTGCAYTATVGGIGAQPVAGSGLVFTAGGHGTGTGTGRGVYVETKNLGGGLSDFPFHLSVDCGKRPLADEGMSILHLNLEGTDTFNGPWRDRHARIASWMGATQIIPDVLLLQEVPASKCYVFHCDPQDYEALFSLMAAIETATGVRYRVALLSTGPSTEGRYPLFQGNAVLYNPVRLRNTMTYRTSLPSWYPIGRTVEVHESHPCQSPPADWYWSCAAQVDHLWGRGAEEPVWGLHYAVQGAAFARFVLAEPPRSDTATIDVYDVHALFIPNSDGTPDLGPIGDAVTALEELMPDGGNRLIPPIMAGDFNTSEYWMTKHTTELGQPFEQFDIAGYAPEAGRHPENPDFGDVIGVLVGEPRAFASLFAARTVTTLLLPQTGPGMCGGLDVRWSDHCGQYAELRAAPR